MDSRKKAWVYARMASPEAESLAALEMQRNALYGLAAQHEYEVVGCSSECAGGLTLDREGFKEVMQAADKAMFDVLIIKDHSRLTRSFMDWAALENEFERLGIQIHTLDYGIISPTQDEMILSIREGIQKRAAEQIAADQQSVEQMSSMDAQQM